MEFSNARDVFYYFVANTVNSGAVQETEKKRGGELISSLLFRQPLDHLCCAAPAVFTKGLH